MNNPNFKCETLRQFMAAVLERSQPETTLERGTIHSGRFKSCGIKFNLDYGAVITNPEAISIGDNVYIGRYVYFDDISVIIENGVLIGPYVTIASLGMKKSSYPVIIKEGSWIAAHAFIAPGVTIGCGSTVAAGAVVLEDVPDRVLVAGNPAKVIKNYE